MEYRNKLTGVIVEVSSKISGDVWEPVNPVPVSVEKDAEPVKKTTKKTTKKSKE